MIRSIALFNPFYGDYKITLVFGALPDDPHVRSLYERLGIDGHTGIDFGVPTGTIILASSAGIVIQSGYNGEFGISDATGTATGPHLHFGIMPNNPNLNNGYAGYIDPMPYLTTIRQDSHLTSISLL